MHVGTVQQALVYCFSRLVAKERPSSSFPFNLAAISSSPRSFSALPPASTPSSAKLSAFSPFSTRFDSSSSHLRPAVKPHLANSLPPLYDHSSLCITRHLSTCLRLPGPATRHLRLRITQPRAPVATVSPHRVDITAMDNENPASKSADLGEEDLVDYEEEDETTTVDKPSDPSKDASSKYAPAFPFLSPAPLQHVVLRMHPS